MFDFDEWKYLGQGRHRAVWRRNNFVIKVPLCMDGLYDNWHEYSTYKRYGAGKHSNYARCRLLQNYYLVMQHVTDRYRMDPMPKHQDWFDQIDCGQVGANYAGRIVAYDYGY